VVDVHEVVGRLPRAAVHHDGEPVALGAAKVAELKCV
jgi:hypothetical protein